MNKEALKYKIAQTVVTKEKISQNCGGIFVGGEIIKNADNNVDSLAQYVTELQNSVKSPLLVAGDLEAGCGEAISGLTRLTSLMGLGAANSPELAYSYGLITGKEARSIGMNWAFAPVVDLNVNPHSSVVSIRSIGDNPQKAIPLLKEVIKGMQDGGIAACIKHFPGDGVDWRDQHVTASCNSLSQEEYMKLHGRAFAELCQEAYTVMAGHISLPAFQKERLDGCCPPATLSEELLVNLLRKEMGFKGLVVSDALEMGGFLGWNGSNRESEVIAFKNGCDMMLWPHEHYVADVLSAVENGFISEKRVDEAFERIEELKQKLGLYDNKYSVPLTAAEKSEIQRAQKEIYESSIVLECDKTNQLPLGKETEKIAVIPVRYTDTFTDCTDTVIKELEKRGFKVQLYTDVWVHNIKEICDANDKLLFLLFSKPHRPNGPVDFSGWDDVSRVWAALNCGREKTLVAGFGSPYYKNQYFERANTYINAYNSDKLSAEYAVKAMTGEIDFKGVSPVEL